MANNGSTSSSLSNKILDAFEILAQAEVNAAQFDKTITGIIVACEDEATGRYRVQYQNAIFYAYSSALDVTYSKGTSVQVKIPNNDFSGRKIIIGTVEENGIDYGTIVEDPLLRYEYIGIDCIGSTAQNDLGSYWEDETNNIVLYDKEKNKDELNLNEEMLVDNLKKGNSLLLGATFKTNIPDIQRFKGDYGIKYTLTFRDKSNVSATVDRYYIVDIDKMSGDPYAYSYATEQIVPFDIDNENFCYVKKIELFAKNFIYKDDKQPADIFISNLKLQVAHRIPDDEFAGTALSILTPDGNYFNAAEGITTKRAIAQLRIKGKVTDSIVKQIKYYWFIEDLRIDKTREVGYHKYGGKGWRCLNSYSVTEGTEENPVSVDYISAKEEMLIKKENSNSKETKYKCVINYNGQILEKEFYFINYDIKNEVTIIADRNPNFIDSIGATTLTCIATDGITYQWAKIDADGGFEALDETTAANNDYEHALQEYNNLQAAMASKEEPANDYNYDLLNYYETVMQSYETEERRQENQVINLQANSIYGEATYKCQAFDKNGTSLGIGSQLVTNYFSAENNVQTGSLVINNGAQIFKYSAKGIAPTSGQFYEPQTILPLGFTLRNAQGIEIPMDALNDSDVTWIVPIKNTMIASYIGTVVAHDAEMGIEIYNGKSLGYNINENYYANKNNNEIELRVQYQGLVYIARTNLFFTKDGNDGTNGTGYVLKVLPSADTIGRLKTVKAGQTGSDWLRIQLWYNGIKIYEGNNTGNATTGKVVKLKWEMVGEKKDTTHNITVQSNDTNPPTWTAATTYDNTATDIAKAIVDYDGTRIVATAPIIYSSNWNNTNYKISLKEGTGFTHVTYSEDGLIPDYDNYTPFEISVHKLINGEWGDITGHNSLTYSWAAIGNLKIKSGYVNTDAAIMFEPIGRYNSEDVHNAVTCVVKENSTTIGTLHIPVHFLLNTYGHAALNEWDGNSISLDADGNTMLLAPQAGFGKKEGDNSYTGVLLGTVKDYINSTEQTGLFGYKSGVRTLFLNSANGAAIFGKVGQNGSQIVIDPNSDIGRLYTNKFYKTYDNKTGLPSSYNTSNESGEGALIDLTTPEIRWGNGNFKVSKDGHITAKGGGQIAGWNIDDNALFTNTKNSSSNVQIASVNFERTINGTKRSDWRMAFSNNFGVSSEGIMHAASGIIGSGSNKITLGKSSDNNGYSAIYSGSKSAFNANASGFYIGTDGIALGGQNSNGESKFQVTNGGILTAREGTIGGWSITRNTLAAGNIVLNANGSMSGGNSDGGTWSIATNGTATFNKIIANTGGSIGGWTIGSTYLRGAADSSGRYIQINSNGSISASNSYWNISRDGTATFKKIRITSDGDSNSSSATLINANGKFVVKADGSMKATAADIEGEMTATTGKIGNWSISNGAITNTYATLTADGKITATAGSIGGWSIEDGKLLSSNNNSQVTGLASSSWPGDPAFFAGGPNPWKDGNWANSVPFYVTNEGYLKATNAKIEGVIKATSGEFDRCTINGTCVVPASTITGTLASNNIPNLNASKITGGTISASLLDGVSASFGQLGASSVSAMTVSADIIAVNTQYGHFEIGGVAGKSGSFWIMTGWTESGGGSITFKGRNCTFTKGIITSIGGETTATAWT